MPTASQVVDVLIEEFERSHSALLEDAVMEALKILGLGEYEALEWLDDRQTRLVNHYLAQRQPEQLPFDISLTRPYRLIGKARIRTYDAPETKRIRQEIHLIEPLIDALSAIGDNEFEHVCAAVMLRAGAIDAAVTAASDDGGIDFFGRIPVLVGDTSVPTSLVRTTLEIRPVLFLGQAKRYLSGSLIGRPELQKFAGQVRDCLDKFRNMVKPPSHRVPDGYYETGEPCLTFFITTARFTTDARDYAQSVNMILADGHLLAELLVYWGFGEKSLSSVDAAAVVDWVASIKTGTAFSTS
jgi:Restriction endonuclease